jgi:hypothetical protein
MAAMTAAFALGQLAGPFSVSLLRTSPSAALGPAHLLAATVLLLGTLTLRHERDRR